MRFYDFFSCCTRSETAALAPELLHTLRNCCTLSEIAALAPKLLHTLQNYKSRFCCTLSILLHTLQSLLHTLRYFKLAATSTALFIEANKDFYRLVPYFQVFLGVIDNFIQIRYRLRIGWVGDSDSGLEFDSGQSLESKKTNYFLFTNLSLKK